VTSLCLYTCTHPCTVFTTGQWLRRWCPEENRTKCQYVRASLILRTFVSRDIDILTKSFTTYVRPILEYCTPVMCYKIISGEVSLHCNLVDLSDFTQTRGHKCKLYKHQSNVNAYKYFFCNRILWYVECIASYCCRSAFFEYI